jgi:ElaB protein
MNSQNRVPSAGAAAIDDLRALIVEAEQALATAGDNADEKLFEIKERLEAALDQGKTALNRWRDVAAAQARRADDIVRSHPYETAGVALGVGLLVGLLISPRRAA